MPIDPARQSLTVWKRVPSPVRKPVVHVLVVARDPLRVLLLLRPASRVAGWQSVTGRVEPTDADLRAACVREIAEEAGLPPPEELVDLGPESERDYDGYDGGRYRQRSFVATYPTAPPVRLSDEHEEIRWVEPREAIAMVRWDSDRDAIKWVLGRDPALK